MSNSDTVKEYWIRSYEYEITECKKILQFGRTTKKQKEEFTEMLVVLEKGLERVKK